MNAMVEDGAGLRPAGPPTGPEFPDAEKLRVYGDVMFLTLRSAHHAAMRVDNLRAAMEPPVELGQYHIFRFDDIPRGLITWARLGADAEARFVRGEPLRAEDWRSGPNLWVIDLIAPYKGLSAGIGRWMMREGNLGARSFYFRRVTAGNTTRRIVHVDFDRDGGKARMLREEDFLPVP